MCTQSNKKQKHQKNIAWTCSSVWLSMNFLEMVRLFLYHLASNDTQEIIHSRCATGKWAVLERCDTTRSKAEKSGLYLTYDFVCISRSNGSASSIIISHTRLQVEEINALQSQITPIHLVTKSECKMFNINQANKLWFFKTSCCHDCAFCCYELYLKSRTSKVFSNLENTKDWYATDISVGLKATQEFLKILTLIWIGNPVNVSTQ